MKNLFLLLASFMLLPLTGCNGVRTNDDSAADGKDINDGRTAQEIMFDDGNYAMFIHFGLFSKMAGEWKGEKYYGISEWIMNPARADIPPQEYMKEAAGYCPDQFDAEAIVKLAKDAGMKYIVITAKHHEGFASFKSDACDFNVYDATPLKRDLIGELADACHKNGLGIGFYYSQWADWTAPGGSGGPLTDAEGNPVSYEQYFRTKCIPQLEELTTRYGELEMIWFDTPGGITREQSEELVSVVRKNQPHALISSRIGNGVGDFESGDDMDIPVLNVPGRWESIDVTSAGWGYNQFDSEFKSPEWIVHTLVSVIARGGTFMLNVGPDGKGVIPPEVCASLRSSGEWVKRHPQVVYSALASPWGQALPWGDAVLTKDGKMELVVFDWPRDGKLWVPGIRNELRNVRLDSGKKLSYRREGSWICIDVPDRQPDVYASVIEVETDGVPDIDPTTGVAPYGYSSHLPVGLADCKGCSMDRKQWMEKFGEWKFKKNANSFEPGGNVEWKVNFQKEGYYDVEIEYNCDEDGTIQTEWHLETDEGEVIWDSQNCGNQFVWKRLGWIHITSPGIHTLTLYPEDDAARSTHVAGLRLTPVAF